MNNFDSNPFQKEFGVSILIIIQICMISQPVFPKLYWFARITALLAIGFISMFALDSFESGQSISDQLLHFGLHLFPSLILLGVFGLACYFEKLGGLVFMLIGIGLAPVIYMHNYSLNHSLWISLEVVALINLPFVLIGFAYWRRGRLKTLLES